MKLTKESRYEIMDIVECVNSPKHRLIELLSQLEGIEGAAGRSTQFGNIIAALETWQHKATKGLK